MNLRQFRWPVALVTLAVTLAGLFGAGRLVRSQTIDQPLMTALAGLEGLVSYQVVQAGDVPEVEIHPAPDANLRDIYTEVDRRLRQILKGSPYGITVLGSPTAALERAAERMNLYLQEAVATGAFAAMADRIAAEAASMGAEAQVAVDERRVYLTVRQGDAYLYRVVERPAWPPVVPAGGGMGL